MTVLVAWAGVHGSTRGVAERIRERLEAGRVSAQLVDAREVADVSSYEAIVLGSAIHNSGWMNSAVEALRGALASQAPPPLWLFSVGTVGDHSSMVARPASWLLRRLMRSGWPRNIATLLGEPAGREHRASACVLRRGHYSLPGHAVFRAMGGRYGDHRPWAAIDAWADEIAREVTRRNYAV